MKDFNTALHAAARFEIDDVIDPATTRDVVAKTLRALPPMPPRTGRKRIVDPF